MNEREAQAKSIDALRGLLERLGSPDVTLAEANLLRCQVHQMLGEADGMRCDEGLRRERFVSAR
jgi:hypothetical protein